MIGFIGPFDTARHYTTITSSLAVTWQRLPTAMADVPVPVGFRNIPALSYQFLTATAHNH
jgi:hypothetical protein